jgi:transcriptional regulator with XRE-family HTH domain
MSKQEAIRNLRGKCGEIQPVFAERLGVSTVTVARWETSGPPIRKEPLGKLYALAIEKGVDPSPFEYFHVQRTHIAPIKEVLADKFPDFDINWSEGLQAKWLDAFKRMMS